MGRRLQLIRDPFVHSKCCSLASTHTEAASGSKRARLCRSAGRCGSRLLKRPPLPAAPEERLVLDLALGRGAGQLRTERHREEHFHEYHEKYESVQIAQSSAAMYAVLSHRSRSVRARRVCKVGHGAAASTGRDRQRRRGYKLASALSDGGGCLEVMHSVCQTSKLGQSWQNPTRTFSEHERESERGCTMG
eukprot:6175006-Pleurochrysis_carterae.AAC.3